MFYKLNGLYFLNRKKIIIYTIAFVVMTTSCYTNWSIKTSFNHDVI